jgi:DNA-binding MarR family transcriptional regulator
VNGPIAIRTAGERSEHLDLVAGALLPRAALLVRLLVRQVRNPEISRTEGEVLTVLGDGPRRVTDLAELEGLAQPTMTLLIKRLSERGWVTRDGLASDGRVVMVSITNAGRAALSDFRAQFLAAMRSDLERLSGEQLEALASATEALGSFLDVLQESA